ncbi:hypothetical protein LCGC14_0777980 [marine sediment metagenome]|uniref:Uncharacterized protein n=1 Tax=marine sediment metagenome TaxID=412755 RepID=A0A0F9SG99_9ZZZZ|nr:hypothetical protein [Desulfobacterales bacterium]
MELIIVNSREYRDRFAARLVEKGYEKTEAWNAMIAWEEATSSLANTEAGPEYEADECFIYWKEHEPTF